MTFDRLGLSPEILRAVADQGYTQPTEIQERAIPVILEGGDLLACAQTGTGKTAGFTLPMLELLGKTEPPRNRRQRPVRGLVLTPTRELAAQVGKSISTYGRKSYLRSTEIYGGVKYYPQIHALRAGVDIVVATPGRLMDHIQRGTLDLSKIEIFILDEADRMLDMGFIDDIKKIMTTLPSQRQNLLFSATFSKEIRNLAAKLLQDPVSIEIESQTATPDRVNQLIHPVARARKRELLTHLITDGDLQRVLVFTRTRHGADNLAKQLETDGISATAIHGEKTQNARNKALRKFKKGHVRALVATDVAARGLDIDDLSHVVNFDLSHVPEDYVHRIGRTGRAGRKGDAISLVCSDERKMLRQIERHLKMSIPRETIPGFEPDFSAISDRKPNPRGRRSSYSAKPWERDRRSGKPRSFAKPRRRDEGSRDELEQRPARRADGEPSKARSGKPGPRKSGDKPWERTLSRSKRPGFGKRAFAAQGERPEGRSSHQESAEAPAFGKPKNKGKAASKKKHAAASSKPRRKNKTKVHGDNEPFWVRFR